jgi:hypothetical protein
MIKTHRKKKLLISKVGIFLKVLLFLEKEISRKE